VIKLSPPSALQRQRNYLFFGSDHGGGESAQRCGLIGNCRLNGTNPVGYLLHVQLMTTFWPVNRVSMPLPWRVTLPSM